MQRVEELVQTLEDRNDPVARATAQELMKTLLSLHRNGLDRLLQFVSQSESGPELAAVMAKDSVIGSLLLLHGLHPIALDLRVQQALDQVRPMFRGRGCDLEVVEASSRVVRIRLVGSCSLSSEAIEHYLEEAFVAHTPEVQVIEVEDPSRPVQMRLALPILY
jgi:Fe-S cluster biogenesis protein NfuA